MIPRGNSTENCPFVLHTHPYTKAKLHSKEQKLWSIDEACFGFRKWIFFAIIRQQSVIFPVLPSYFPGSSIVAWLYMPQVFPPFPLAVIYFFSCSVSHLYDKSLWVLCRYEMKKWKLHQQTVKTEKQRIKKKNLINITFCCHLSFNIFHIS